VIGLRDASGAAAAATAGSRSRTEKPTPGVANPAPHRPPKSTVTARKIFISSGSRLRPSDADNPQALTRRQLLPQVCGD